MEKELSLEKVTSLLLAAQKIRAARESNVREDGNMAVKVDSLSLIRDTMQIISEYIPVTHRANFSNALRAGHHYCGAYKNLKSHFREAGNQSPDLNLLLGALRAIMPILENRHRAPISKVMNILEAIQD